MATRVSGCSDRCRGVGDRREAGAERVERGRPDGTVLHVDLDRHADLRRLLEQVVQVARAHRGIAPDAQLGELDRHRGAGNVLGDRLHRLDVGGGRRLGLPQVLDRLAQQVQADVDALRVEFLRDRDGLVQGGAGHEATDQITGAGVRADGPLQAPVRRRREEKLLDHQCASGSACGGLAVSDGPGEGRLPL